MEQQREKPMTISELACAVNLSTSYLTRLFREATGISPAEYYRLQRLDHAHELVVSSFLTVKEIMAAVGWNDPSHFSREFKRRFGSSPRTLRVRLRG
jgi:AraC family transcriptional regulator